MERKYGLILWCMLLGCLMSQKVYAASADKDISIKQIAVEMPEVIAFVDCEIDSEELLGGDASLGEKRLTFSNVEKVQALGISYYFLVDISASVPASYFEKIKQEIAIFADELGAKDEMTLYTFGYEVNEIFSHETDTEKIKNMVEQLKNPDHNTLLFEAIDQASQEAIKQTKDKRIVMVVITDGEDFALGKATQGETLTRLLQSGLSMEAVALDCSKKECINNLGEFARNSGGMLYIAGKEDFGTAFSQIYQKAVSGSKITWLARDNRVSNQMERLVVCPSGEDGQAMKEILVMNSKPDIVAPEILSVEKISDYELRITFSEEVLSADQISAWKVTRQGENIPVESVNPAETDEKRQIELTTAKFLYGGSYTVEGIGITDASKEENPLRKKIEFTLEGEEPKEITEPEGKTDSYSVLLATVILLCMTIFALIIIGILLYQKIKKNKGIAKVGGKHVLLSNMIIEAHEEGKIIEETGKKITLIVDKDGKNTSKIDTVINRSLFVGRTPICNVYFNDKSLANQHFVLEYDGFNMYVTDLNTMSGTKVNGIPVGRRHRLNGNDVITAGSIHFRIRW